MKKLLLIFLIIFGLGLWLWGVNDPYVGIYNTNNNYLSLASKNFLRFGIQPLKFAPTYYAGEQLPAKPEYYLHHPIAMFYFALIPFKLFGFDNWVARAATGIFLLGSTGMIYLLGKELWNKRVGLRAMIFAIWFPMTSFFWKYIFFEQATMFFNLIISYFVVRYAKNNYQGNGFRHEGRNGNIVTLGSIGLFTFLSTATDWYGGYLLFPFLFLLFSPYKKEMRRVMLVYFPMMSLTILAFIIYVYSLEGTLSNVSAAVEGRAVDAELFRFAYWPMRLIFISIVRSFLYFTPVGLIFGSFWVWRNRHLGKWRLGEWMLVGLLILGILNIVFLPTASWGHSYFLFYLIPFFAYSSAIVIEKLEWKGLVIVIGCLVVSAIGVQYFKQIQVKKQLWKYEVARQINDQLSAYETIGITNFPGDVFENYFLHPSKPVDFNTLTDWAASKKNPDVTKLVFSCAGECTEGELEMVNSLKKSSKVNEYRIGDNIAWLISKGEKSEVTGSLEAGKEEMPKTSEVETIEARDAIWIRWYRRVRDIIGATQI